MKRIFVYALVVVTLFYTMSTPLFLRNVEAQSKTDTSVELPYPGLFADHPLYFLKDIRDKIWLLLIHEPDARSDLLRHLSDKKVGMAESMAKLGKWQLAGSMVKEAEEEMNQATSDAQKAKNSKQKDITDLTKDLLDSNTHQYDALVDMNEIFPNEFISEITSALSSNIERTEAIKDLAR